MFAFDNMCFLRSHTFSLIICQSQLDFSVATVAAQANDNPKSNKQEREKEMEKSRLTE